MAEEICEHEWHTVSRQDTFGQAIFCKKCDYEVTHLIQILEEKLKAQEENSRTWKMQAQGGEGTQQLWKDAYIAALLEEVPPAERADEAVRDYKERFEKDDK